MPLIIVACASVADRQNVNANRIGFIIFFSPQSLSTCVWSKQMLFHVVGILMFNGTYWLYSVVRTVAKTSIFHLCGIDIHKCERLEITIGRF